MYEVEKNIPIPRKKGKGKTAFLLSLDVGDSFIFTTEERNGVDNWYNLARAAGLKVKIRQVEDDQFRVWRTK